MSVGYWAFQNEAKQSINSDLSYFRFGFYLLAIMTSIPMVADAVTTAYALVNIAGARESGPLSGVLYGAGPIPFWIMVAFLDSVPFMVAFFSWRATQFFGSSVWGWRFFAIMGVYLVVVYVSRWPVVMGNLAL